MLLYRSQQIRSNINKFHCDNTMLKFCLDTQYYRYQQELILGRYSETNQVNGEWVGVGGGVAKGVWEGSFLLTAAKVSKAQPTLHNFLFFSFLLWQFCESGVLKYIFQVLFFIKRPISGLNIQSIIKSKLLNTGNQND